MDQYLSAGKMERLFIGFVVPIVLRTYHVHWSQILTDVVQKNERRPKMDVL